MADNPPSRGRGRPRGGRPNSGGVKRRRGSPSNLGGARRTGVMNEAQQHLRDTSVFAIKRRWNIESLDDIFPAYITPHRLEISSITNYKTIANKIHDLAVAQALFMRVRRNTVGSYIPFGFTHTLKVLRHIKVHGIPTTVTSPPVPVASPPIPRRVLHPRVPSENATEEQHIKEEHTGNTTEEEHIGDTTEEEHAGDTTEYEVPIDAEINAALSHLNVIDTTLLSKKYAASAQIPDNNGTKLAHSRKRKLEVESEYGSDGDCEASPFPPRKRTASSKRLIAAGMKLAAQSEDPNSRMDKNPVKPRARRVKTSDNAGATNKRVCKGKMQSAEGVMEAEGPRPGFETLPPRSRSTSLDSIGSADSLYDRLEHLTSILNANSAAMEVTNEQEGMTKDEDLNVVDAQNQEKTTESRGPSQNPAEVSQRSTEPQGEAVTRLCQKFSTMFEEFVLSEGLFSSVIDGSEDMVFDELELVFENTIRHLKGDVEHVFNKHRYKGDDDEGQN